MGGKHPNGARTSGPQVLKCPNLHVTCVTLLCYCYVTPLRYYYCFLGCVTLVTSTLCRPQCRPKLYSSVVQLPWWLGSAPRRESASGHHGQWPAPAHPRERPRGEHAHLMTSAGRQPCPGSPACTPPCQDCSNRAILAVELTYRQLMVRRGGCGRKLTAKKNAKS